MPSSSSTPIPPTNQPTIQTIKLEGGAITKLPEKLIGPNWMTWHVHMITLLGHCRAKPYTMGEIPCPDREVDPISYDNWVVNDNYANFLITNNVDEGPIVHIQSDATSYKAWKSLEAIYEDKSLQTAVAVIRNLWHTTADEDTNINDHLTTLKKYWERLNLVNDDNFKIPEIQFKIAIASSLPSSWDSFTEPYVGIYKDSDAGNLKQSVTSQEFIGIIKEQYARRLR